MGSIGIELDRLAPAVAQNLKVARELCGLSPEEAAARTGEVSASYIRRLERGEHSPTIDMLGKLCNAYGTTLAKFFASLPLDPPARKRA